MLHPNLRAVRRRGLAFPTRPIALPPCRGAPRERRYFVTLWQERERHFDV
jgi:hypothetical protein